MLYSSLVRSVAITGIDHTVLRNHGTGLDADALGDGDALAQFHVVTDLGEVTDANVFSDKRIRPDRAPLADMDALSFMRHLPFCFVALPIIRCDIALTDIEATGIRDEYLGKLALSLLFQFDQLLRQGVAQNGIASGGET